MAQTLAGFGRELRIITQNGETGRIQSPRADIDVTEQRYTIEYVPPDGLSTVTCMYIAVQIAPSPRPWSSSLTCPSHVVLGNVGTSLGSPLVMLLDAIGDGKKGHDPVTLKAVRSTRVLRDLYEESERLDDFGPVLREHCPQLKTVRVFAGARAVDGLMPRLFDELVQSLEACGIQVAPEVQKVVYPGQYAGSIPTAIDRSTTSFLRASVGEGYGVPPYAPWGAQVPPAFVDVGPTTGSVQIPLYRPIQHLDVATTARDCCRAIASVLVRKAPYVRGADVKLENGTWVHRVPIQSLVTDYLTPEGIDQLLALASAHEHESSNAAATYHLGGRYFCMASEEWVLREDYQQAQRQHALDGVALAGMGGRSTMSGRAASGAALAGKGDRPGMSERAAVAHSERANTPVQLAKDELRDVLSEKLRPAFRRAREAGVSTRDFESAVEIGLECGNREPLSSDERRGQGRLLSPEDVSMETWDCRDIRGTWGQGKHKYHRLALAFRRIATELERLAAEAEANDESSNDEDDDNNDDDDDDDAVDLTVANSDAVDMPAADSGDDSQGGVIDMPAADSGDDSQGGVIDLTGEPSPKKQRVGEP